MINELKPNQIFVFGSNLAGLHMGGAAKQALDQFGAIIAQGEGLQGQSYAFPTLGYNFEGLTARELMRSRDNLYLAAKEHPDNEFLLTKVGCGIAGYEEEVIKGLFENSLVNIILPEDWK